MSKRKDKKARRLSASSLEALQRRNATISAGVASRYGREEFTPFALEQKSNKWITSELSKARSILRKRYERAVSAGVYLPEQARRIRDLLTPVREIPVSDRAEQLSLIARELSRSNTTIAGARSYLEKVVSDFQGAGFDYVNSGNVKEFLAFLDEFSAKERDKLYGSGLLYKYYESQKSRIARGDAVKVSRRSFLLWLSKEEM